MSFVPQCFFLSSCGFSKPQIQLGMFRLKCSSCGHGDFCDFVMKVNKSAFLVTENIKKYKISSEILCVSNALRE